MSDRFGHGVYSDEALWRARYDNAVAEARFWRNLAYLLPFAVPRTPVPLITVPQWPRRPPPPQGAAAIPHQRTKHPAAARLTEQALRNSNRGGRA